MIASTAMGDAHNFNRRVSYFEENGKGFLKKPRCMFWEHLFLDPNSKFRAFVRNLDNRVNFDEILGNISIFSQNNFSTGTAQLIEEDVIENKEMWLWSYGKLLAFVSALGITDLHRENIFNVESRPRLIDVECVFWGVELPSETFLLPKTDFEWSKSIWLSTTFAGLNSLNGEDVEKILNGYTSVLNFLHQYSQDLSDFFNTIPFASQPIRLLVERTRDYRKHMDHNDLSVELFLWEELEQMLRGDIPYFFGFAGKRDIYFYNSPETTTPLLSRKPIIFEKLQRAFKSPEELLAKDRLVRLKKQGVVEIAARLLDFKLLPHRSSQGNFYFYDSYLRIIFDGLALQAKQGLTRD